jgi:hypothetical protein
MARQNTEDKSQKTEGGGTQTATGSGLDLAAENAALKARIAELESAKSRLDADETLIVAKMAKGLRREQARAVINRQREFDGRKKAESGASTIDKLPVLRAKQKTEI